MSEAVNNHGDPESENAEREIAERFWNRIRLMATRFLRDAAAGEDVAQETIRRVVVALRADRVHDREAIAGFVLQTARNICLHESRSARRKQSAIAQLGAGDPSPSSTPDPLGNLLAGERLERLLHAIRQLEESDRRLLELFYVTGLDAGEVGDRMQLTASAVRVRKHRALHRVMEILERSRNDVAAAGTKGRVSSR